MAPRELTADEERNREQVILSIETVAARLSAQVAELQRFVAQLRPADEMNPLGLFPALVPGNNGHGKDQRGRTT